MEELDVDDVCRLGSSVAVLLLVHPMDLSISCVNVMLGMRLLTKNFHQCFRAELSRIDMRLFVRTQQTQGVRLKRRCSDESVEDISLQFGSFLRAYREQEIFEAAVPQCEREKRGFIECWAVMSMRFHLLQEFYGGIATVKVTRLKVTSRSLVGRRITKD